MSDYILLVLRVPLVFSLVSPRVLRVLSWDLLLS